ncbi:MAG: hypothetical protein ACKVQB_05145 [Bacteroidia bacterium]
MDLKKIAGGAVLIGIIIFTIVSCSHYDMEKAETKISKNGEDESHFNGQNCMNCHSSGGNGEGWFSIAGSVYKSDKSTQNPNGKIFLYADPNGQGELKYTIELDELGNFYTTETINFEGGLYPVHQNSNGNKKYMASPILTGQCQSCHNNTTDKIWND